MARNKKDKRLRKFLHYVMSLFGSRVVLLKLPTSQVTVRKAMEECDDLAIVMQGPIVESDDFTYETAKSYRRLFPGALIVVSTWVDQPESSLEKLRSLGVKVCASEKPRSSGAMNINFQIVSTLAGIRCASDAGALFVIKTRTDCRLYATNIWSYLKGLWQLFPVQGGASMQGRLLALDYATRMYVPYHVSDIFMFGHIQDMLLYWDVPLSEHRPLDRKECGVLGNIWKEQIPEVYLGKMFAQHHLIAKESNGVDAWWRFLADFFVVIDRSALGFYWVKYSMSNENFLEDEQDAKAFAVVSFRDWVCFYTASDVMSPCLDVDFKNLTVDSYVDVVEI